MVFTAIRIFLRTSTSSSLIATGVTPKKSLTPIPLSYATTESHKFQLELNKGN